LVDQQRLVFVFFSGQFLEARHDCFVETVKGMSKSPEAACIRSFYVNRQGQDLPGGQTLE
jgi:hypothetical protein